MTLGAGTPRRVVLDSGIMSPFEVALLSESDGGSGAASGSRKFAAEPYTGCVIGAAVSVPILVGQSAPSDPSTTPEVKNVMTSLAPLLGSSSSSSSSSLNPLLNISAAFLTAAAPGKPLSSFTITSSSSSAEYVSIGGVPVASPSPSSLAAGSSSSNALAPAVGGAVGGIVFLVIISIVVWRFRIRNEKPKVAKAPVQNQNEREHLHENPLRQPPV